MEPEQDEPKTKTIYMERIPVHVENVHINGLGRTKADIIDKHLKKLFLASDFMQLVDQSNNIKMKLERLGLFREIQIEIDTTKGNSNPHSYDVTYNVIEKRRFTGKMSTLFGSNDGTMMVNLNMPNLLGRGEMVHTEMKWGLQEQGADLYFTKPLFADVSAKLQFGANMNTMQSPWIKNVMSEKGISVHYLNFLNTTQHRFSLSAMWRNMVPQDNNFNSRISAGHDLNCNAKYTFSYDDRDDKILPNHGKSLEKTWEVSGLLGDCRYLKSHGHAQLNLPLSFMRSVLQFSFAGGLMMPINSLFSSPAAPAPASGIDAASQLEPSPVEPISLCDRFFIGGPMTMRGFKLNCLASEDDVASGGTSFWTTGLHLYTPLPFLPGYTDFSNYVRTHFFFNAGNLKDIDVYNLQEDASKLIQQIRWCYGVGVVMKLGGIARMELNYCFPRSPVKDTGIYNGLQFGIGVHFL